MKRTLIHATLLTGLCIALALVTFALSGCSTIKDIAQIVNPTYSFRDVRPRVALALPLSASTIDFDLTIGVDNPNAVGIRLDRMDFDLFVNDSHVINGISDQQIRIPARGVGDVHIRTRVGYNELRSAFQTVADLIQGNRARYEVRGNAYYDTPAGQLKFPVTVYSSR